MPQRVEIRLGAGNTISGRNPRLAGRGERLCGQENAPLPSFGSIRRLHSAQWTSADGSERAVGGVSREDCTHYSQRFGGCVERRQRPGQAGDMWWMEYAKDALRQAEGGRANEGLRNGRLECGRPIGMQQRELAPAESGGEPPETG